MADGEEDSVWILPLNDGEEIHVIHQSIESTDDVGSSLIEIVEETSSAVPETNPEAPKKTKASHGGKDKVRSNKSSLAWRYFEKETDVTARCTLCNQVCKHSGNTTNLMQHLTRKHALFCTAAINENKRKLTLTSDSNTEGESTDDDITQAPSKKMKYQSQGKLTTIEEAFERTRSFKTGGKIYDKLTNAILYMIAVDKMPLSTVENEGFRYVLKTAVPPYTPPSRKTVTRLLDARYDFLKERFIAKLGKAVAYSLTCDNWTDISNQSYLGVTVHYVTEELTMENGCIGVFALNESHTAQYLTDTLNSVTEEFGLEHAKITAIVSDSAANIKKAIRDMLGADKHLPCFAHTVSHLVPSALVSMPVVREVIAKVKSIVTLTRKSVVASDELKKLQLRDGKTEGTALKFIQDVPTRWNSTLYMLERFLLLEQYVYPVMLKCPKAPDMLKREEIHILKDVVSLMKPVERIIKNVSGDSYPTCSVIIPIIHCLEDAIRKYDPSTNDGAEFKKNLQGAIATRFKDFEHSKVLAKSTILDPRFKKVHFQSARAATNAISAINDKMRSIELPQTETVADALPDKENDPDDIWSYHDRLVASKSNPVVDTHTQELSIEFKQYLNQQVIARDANPLEYWKSFKLAFPSMYALGVKYVSVVGTSVPSERLFSQAGDIKTDNRSRLSGEHLNKLMFLSSLALKDWALE